MKLRGLFILRDMRVSVLNLTFALMLFSAMFLTYRGFVESEFISKWYAFIGGAILFGFVTLNLCRTAKITIDLLTISICIFIAYLFARTAFCELPQPNIFTLSLAAFLFAYLFFKLMPNRYRHSLDIIVIGVCLIQAVYGFMQYAGTATVNQGFDIVGSFDNPAGFAASLSAGLPFCFSVMHKGKRPHYFGISSLVVIVSAIILSGSRAGILAAAIVLAIYLGNQYYDIIKKKHSYIYPFVGIVFILFFVGLFFLKKNSAIGRLLIWENSCRMIADKPLFGFGPSGFMSKYMVYQGDYFAESPNSSYTLLADNVTHPFNEYLLLSVEYGFVGLLLLLVMIAIVIKSSKRITPSLLCLLSVGIFSSFSYPLRYPFVLILLAYGLSDIFSKQLYVPRINTLSKIVWNILLGTVCIFTVRDIRFENQWGQLAQRCFFEKNGKLLDNYAGLYAQWNGDPMFLYNYAAVLNHAGDYSGSNDIMFQCIDHFNDYDVQQIIADNYDNMNDWDKAEVYYINAHQMIPNRFIPLYRLFKLYEKCGRINEAIRIAETIIDMPVKIQSGAVRKIKSAAKSFIANIE